MLYALIITTMLQSYNSPRPIAVTMTTVPHFTTEQACKNAGIANTNATPGQWVEVKVRTTFVCVPMSV